jgi:signal transduction histidine kinase
MFPGSMPGSLRPKLLQKIETLFDQAVREKGLRLRVMRNDAWVPSDAMLLERILLNLISNAVRYTSRGRDRRRMSSARRNVAYRSVG